MRSVALWMKSMPARQDLSWGARWGWAWRSRFWSGLRSARYWSRISTRSALGLGWASQSRVSSCEGMGEGSGRTGGPDRDSAVLLPYQGPDRGGMSLEKSGEGELVWVAPRFAHCTKGFSAGAGDGAFGEGERHVSVAGSGGGDGIVAGFFGDHGADFAADVASVAAVVEEAEEAGVVEGVAGAGGEEFDLAARWTASLTAMWAVKGRAVRTVSSRGMSRKA